eukprot:TRINITY_DN621_c0_g1_i4.p1 TRINITY_DN621_c0_g1~~TRINITY_DN621_c0_g1_i4.p1  ORF type:complete len:296 (-),score=104.63 TRINITY_DN621_c0_g1_i4:377-1264(-)
MREMVMTELYRSMDVHSARGAFVRVQADFGDGAGVRTLGVYTMFEDPGDSLPASQFDDNDEAGNMYKPDGAGARLTVPIGAAAFVQKAGEDESLDDVTTLLAALHDDSRTTDAASWRARVESVFDMAAFVRWLAVTRATGNWDQYGAMTHNYYLYSRFPIVPVTWIAWDNNFVLGVVMANAGGGGGAAMMPTVPDNAMPMDMMPMNMAMPMNMTRPVGGGGRPPRNDGAGAGAGGGAGRAGALDLSDAAVGQWPLIAFVRDDPVYFAAYRDALQRLLDTTPFWRRAATQDRGRVV